MGDINLSQQPPRSAYRGYVASRPVRGSSFPQHVQNLVVRDYASRLNLQYVLSATEYAMPACYLMLNAILDELPKLAGIICFSIFMLPPRKTARLAIYERVLGATCSLHAALENLSLRRHDDIAAIEDLLDVASVLPALPLRGRYEKDEASMEVRARDPFWSVLSAGL